MALTPGVERRRAVVQIGAAVLVGVSLLFLPVLAAGFGQERSSRFSGLELPVVRWLFVAGALAVLVGTIVDVVTDRPRHRRLALPAATAVVVASALGLVVSEWLTTLIPQRILPSSVRRSTVNVGAGIGLWLALAGAACVVLASSNLYPRLISRVRAVVPRRELCLLCGAFATAVAIALLRYIAWIDVDAAGEAARVPGWSVPWIGPLSLFALWAFAFGVAIALLARHLGPLVIAITACWLVSFLAALVILSSGAIGRVVAVDLLPQRVRDLEPHVGAAVGAWGAFAAGLCGAVLLLVVLAGRAAPQWQRFNATDEPDRID